MVRFAPYLPAPVLVRDGAPHADRYSTATRGSSIAAGDALSQDPTDNVDALEDLGDEIARLAAHIHAATQRLLTLIAEFDRRRGWELGGYRSCAHWLAARTGIDLGAAREKVRTARALSTLPRTSESMARGELSFSAVRALTRVATPANEGDLLELARGCTTAQLERVVRGWRHGSREDEVEWERRRNESRTLSVFPDHDGMYVVKGRLTPELGALLMRAIEAASDALYREDSPPAAGPDVRPEVDREPRPEIDRDARPDIESGARREIDSGARRASESDRSAGRRRADALGLLAERAMAAGFGGRGLGGETVPISGSRAARYQVVLHVDGNTLSAHGKPGRSELEDGTRVSAETSRRLSCDTALVRVRHAPDGSIRSADRRTRTISPALRRALEARDRGCRFPACGLRFTDAHHVEHWADGGETSLSNCVLLCRFHHRLVHEGGWQVGWWGEGLPVFTDPRGGTHFDGRWQPPELVERPVEALIADHRARGAEPDGWTAGARWEREADIPDGVLFRALEALACDDTLDGLHRSASV